MFNSIPENYRRPFILLVAIFLIAIVSAGIMLYQNAQSSNESAAVNTANEDARKASEKLMKAQMNVYYVHKGIYPRDYDELKNYVSSTEDVPSFEELEETIEVVDIKIKGDKSGYLIEYYYRDKPKLYTMTGSYSNEYH